MNNRRNATATLYDPCKPAGSAPEKTRSLRTRRGERNAPIRAKQLKQEDIQSQFRSIPLLRRIRYQKTHPVVFTNGIAIIANVNWPFRSAPLHNVALLLFINRSQMSVLFLHVAPGATGSGIFNNRARLQPARLTS
jgi:hypothetical protein